MKGSHQRRVASVWRWGGEEEVVGGGGCGDVSARHGTIVSLESLCLEDGTTTDGGHLLDML